MLSRDSLKTFFKVKAVLETKFTENFLCAFLNQVNYYGKFTAFLASVASLFVYIIVGRVTWV